MTAPGFLTDAANKLCRTFRFHSAGCIARVILGEQYHEITLYTDTDHADGVRYGSFASIPGRYVIRLHWYQLSNGELMLIAHCYDNHADPHHVKPDRFELGLPLSDYAEDRIASFVENRILVSRI